MATQPNSYDYLIKYLLVGDASVGKTSLLKRYISDTFSVSYTSTIGVDFQISTRTFNNQTIKMQIWDTVGQERFRSISNSYYRGSHCILLIFDIHVHVSFERLEGWLNIIEKNAPDNVKILLVGNKNDIKKRTVSEQEINNFKNKYNLEYFEVSAKTGDNVDNLFDRALELGVSVVSSNDNHNTIVHLHDNYESEVNCVC